MSFSGRGQERLKTCPKHSRGRPVGFRPAPGGKVASLSLKAGGGARCGARRHKYSHYGKFHKRA